MPHANAARHTQRSSFFMGWTFPDYTLVRRSGEPRGRSGELGDPERRVFAWQIAGAADVRAAALEVLAPGGAVGLGVPDFLDRGRVEVAEDRLAVEVGAAERHAAVPQHREGQPRPVAGIVDVRLGVERAGPVVQVGDVDLVGDRRASAR